MRGHREATHVGGGTVDRLCDVGVAGLHRLLSEHERLRRARVLIVVAGMEGALPSVIGGLVKAPPVWPRESTTFANTRLPTPNPTTHNAQIQLPRTLNVGAHLRVGNWKWAERRPCHFPSAAYSKRRNRKRCCSRIVAAMRPCRLSSHVPQRSMNAVAAPLSPESCTASTSFNISRAAS